MARARASRVGWKAKQASNYLLRIGGGWKAAYLDQHNADAKPFIWTAPAADILEKVARGRRALESVH